MIEQTRVRAARHRWSNVTLLNAPVEEAVILLRVDAALFCFTHDVIPTPEAVKNVVSHLKPGARVASIGLRWAARPAPCKELPPGPPGKLTRDQKQRVEWVSASVDAGCVIDQVQ